MRIRLFLFASCSSLAAVAAALPSAAQTTQSAPTAPAEQTDSGLNDIVVTAERRPTTLQRTPVSVEVYDAKALATNGIDNVQDLSAYSPSVNFASNGPRAIVTVRGIGSADVDETGEPTVAISVDGTYTQRPVTLNAAFFDLDRVEVLRGPQGTLFGRNATGGAINIITAKPTFDLGGAASVEYGNYNALRTTGMLNLPVSDTLALRAAFTTSDHDGYQNNGPTVARNADDDNTRAVRLSALWQPASAFTARITAEYSHRGGVGPAYYGIPVQTDSSGNVIDIAPNLSNSVRTNPLNTQNRIDTTMKSIRWNADYDLGGATLTYVGGYADTRFKSMWDLDGTNINTYAFRVNEHIQTLNNEVRLASPNTGPFKWQIGAFAYNERQGLDNQFVDDKPTPVDLFIYDLGVKSQSYAGFGQASYEIASGLSISGGLRYTHDNKREFGTQNSASLGAYFSDGSIVRSLTDRAGTASSSKVTWHAGVDYQLDDQHLLYGKIDTGYKAGGFSDLGQYKPETVTAYEIGSKNRFLDNRLQLNVDAFYEDYSNQQVTQFIAGLGTLTTNAGKSRLYGIESELSFLATPDDKVDLSVNYLSATYRDFLTASGSGNIQLRGNQLPQAPKWALTGSYEHSWRLPNSVVTARVQSTFKSPQYFTFLNLASSRQDSFTKTDLNLTYARTGSKWEVTAYVRNLENSLIWTYSDVSGFFGSYRYQFSDPRTYGARLSLKF